MDGKRHGALSGEPTEVSPHVGGAWNVGHSLEGKNVALVTDRKIVQTWRASNWPAGTYSKATFTLAKAPGGTRITFTQTGVPSEFHREISDGRRTYYWRPLRQLFAKAR